MSDESGNTILPGIDHFVVVMFENRSFDNMLGGLYPKLTEQGLFHGVKKDMYNLLNPVTQGPLVKVPVWQAGVGEPAQIIPYPDPGELFDDMNQQIYSPGTAPDKGAGRPTMGGFVYNYVEQKVKGIDPKAVMQYYSHGSNGNIGITSTLAENYAVSDTYHASGPVQTLVNRIFTHCGQPGTYEKNGKLYNHINNDKFTSSWDPDGSLDYKNVFQLLDAKFGTGSTNWKVYYHDWPLSAMLKYVDDHWHWTTSGGNVFHYSESFTADFKYDVQHNTLPKYSFIEPRYSNKFYGQPNSNHPGGATLNETGLRNGPPPISICYGEQLLKNIYTTLASNEVLFTKTLLVVTYDEHGGLFDHVAPTDAVPPNAGVSNFDYSRYGVRVPAIFINPYIKPRTILRPASGAYPFDHTSIINTLIERFGLSKSLGPRVNSAPTFSGVIKGTTVNPFFLRGKLPSASCVAPKEDPELPIDDREDPSSLYHFIHTAMHHPRNKDKLKAVETMETRASKRD